MSHIFRCQLGDHENRARRETPSTRFRCAHQVVFALLQAVFVRPGDGHALKGWSCCIGLRFHQPPRSWVSRH